MKVFAFNGSPRKGGNIDILLAEAEKAVKRAGHAGDEGLGVHEWTRFDLNTMNIRPCQDCGGCDKTGVCVINDDMVQIRQAIRDADRIILASPVFFFGFVCSDQSNDRSLPGLLVRKVSVEKAAP